MDLIHKNGNGYCHSYRTNFRKTGSLFLHHFDFCEVTINNSLARSEPSLMLPLYREVNMEFLALTHNIKALDDMFFSQYYTLTKKASDGFNQLSEFAEICVVARS